MNNAIKVRPANPKDASPVIDIICQSIEQLCKADHQDDPDTLTRWLANKTPQSFLTWLTNPDNFCVVAEENEKLYGVGLLHRSGEIMLFYLAPGKQRKGIGGKIYDTIEEKAIQWGLNKLHLNSTVSACPFYEAMGYHTAGETKIIFGVLRGYPYEKVVIGNDK